MDRFKGLFPSDVLEQVQAAAHELIRDFRESVPSAIKPKLEDSNFGPELSYIMCRFFDHPPFTVMMVVSPGQNRRELPGLGSQKQIAASDSTIFQFEVTRADRDTPYRAPLFIGGMRDLLQEGEYPRILLFREFWAADCEKGVWALNLEPVLIDKRRSNEVVGKSFDRVLKNIKELGWDGPTKDRATLIEVTGVFDGCAVSRPMTKLLLRVFKPPTD